jgi:dTDP-4-dehydrorhamnose reductase
LDLTKPIEKLFEPIDFDLMINAAAATNVDWCEQHEPEAEQINARAVASLGKICSKRGVRCVHVSTDYVFDGLSSRPRTEEDPAAPISVYGRTKRLGEELLMETDSRHLVVRVSWVFGPDKPSFIDWALDQAATRCTVSAIDDKFSAPTYTLDFAEWIRPLLFEVPTGGILHLCNSGGCTWRQYAQYAVSVAREVGVPMAAQEIQPSTLSSMKSFVAARPVYTIMATDKFSRLTGLTPRPWREAVRHFVGKKYSRNSSRG